METISEADSLEAAAAQWEEEIAGLEAALQAERADKATTININIQTVDYEEAVLKPSIIVLLQNLVYDMCCLVRPGWRSAVDSWWTDCWGGAKGGGRGLGRSRRGGRSHSRPAYNRVCSPDLTEAGRTLVTPSNNTEDAVAHYTYQLSSQT